MKKLHLIKIAYGFLIIIMSFFVVTPPAHAYSLKSGENVQLGENETVSGNLYIAGERVAVEGNVEGDVFCAGQNVTIKGNIGGDLICAAQTITIDGVINGDARLAAQNIDLNGTVQKNATVFTQTISVDSGAAINGELFTAAQNVTVLGTVGSDLYGGSETADIKGRIGRDINLNVEKLTVSENAHVGGKVTYTSSSKADISSEALISGGTTQNTPREDARGSARKTGNQIRISTIIFTVLSSLLSGFVLLWLFPKFTNKSVAYMKEKPGPSVGWGTVFLIGMPLIAIFLLVSLIGIPLAITLIFVWFAALMVCQLFVSLLVGDFIIDKYFPQKKNSQFLRVAIGVIITAILYAIPFFGPLAALIASLWGLGGIVNTVRTSRVAHTKS